MSFGPDDKARKNKEPEKSNKKTKEKSRKKSSEKSRKKSPEQIKEEPVIIESIKEEKQSEINSLQNSEIRKIQPDESKRASVINIDTKIALEYEEEKTQEIMAKQVALEKNS